MNKDKCQLNITHIDFMGYVLSNHGTGMGDSNVDAIVNARKPQNASEVKSFVGLVNFRARFINNLPTKVEPLHKLMRKDVPFEWDPEQDISFEQLICELANAKHLGYFDT